jgi:hypothetical protein
MNKRVIKIAVALFVSTIILGIYTLAASPKFSTTVRLSTLLTDIEKDPDMLVFISPQYAQDKELNSAIENYANSVEEDIGWKTEIIKLTMYQNNYKIIDNIIEDHYQKYKIKACIMVGEDTDTALGGSTSYMRKPSTIPWETIGGEETYDTIDKKVVCKPYKIEVCISLLYPTNDLDYEVKKDQIIDAFNRFSIKRDISFDKETLVFESSELNKNSKDIYLGIECNNLTYRQDPTDLEIEESKGSSYSMYFVHGHSNPSGTDVSSRGDGWFSADQVGHLDTPLFGADGCYVGGWWTNIKDSNSLSPSVSSPWYGSKIFSSKHIYVMALGMLSQNGLTYSVSFIENAVPKLSSGNTIAESVIGNTCIGDTIIIGDPTFHFDI